MVRHDLSQPMALLVRHGLIRPGIKVFDYGCGQGDDLRILGASGIEVTGWDPHFRPETVRSPAPVVNLGFVLNVIENPVERREALTKAWALTEQVLAVSTMIVGQSPVGGLRPHGDGFVTSRGTFQKYYQHAELRALLTQVLGTEPVAVAPGIFFAFRVPEDEQEFLLNRRSGRRASAAGYRVARAPRPSRPTAPSLAERLPTALPELAHFMRQRGRIPQIDELAAAVHTELTDQKVSLARAIDACLGTLLPQEEFESAASARREDLLVHQALGHLNRSTSASRPSAGMVRDIRTHFNNQKELALQAVQYLHGLADESRVQAAIVEAASEGLGILDHRQRLVVDGSRADDLPALLRCYFGCATFLSGEPDGAFVMRIDAARKRVAMWPLVDPKATLPRVEISIRVDLRRQDVGIRPDQRLLLRKGELAGLTARSKQRRAEAAYRAERGVREDAVFEDLQA
jgi:DNA phosphorothioation-associated putative methyltransferase